jgi:membrane protein DedA with SNARE-associated domain
MPELSELITQWGYLAIFFTVILGNLGVPVPEEAILVLAGYFVWDQQLWLPAVLVVGVVGAATGDNIGYWIGRHYGARAVLQYGHWFFITPDRFDSMQRFVSQYGAFGVFFSRFLPGLRFMAGPLAGTTRMPFLPFLVSNVLGAAVYVPLAVAVGYALSYGVGDYVKWVQRLVGRVEHVVLIAAIVSAVVILGWRAFRARGTSSSLE